MTGAERKFALSYVPQEDIIRYNKGSKVFGINKGDYARVLSTTHADNELTVRLRDGREVTYNPKRLSGVSVYKEANRQFAVGDRIQFRAPFREANVKNTELGTITRIADGDFTISLSADRVITFNAERFPHLDHGYAVTSYSSQGKTMDRVLVNAETTETDLLVNQRMAYVAVSRARLDARIYTDSAADLGSALARRSDKTMALEALEQVRHEVTTDNDSVTDLSARAKSPEGTIAVPGHREDVEADSIPRLKGRSILTESNVAVAQKRLNDFERERHLYSFEIEGEQWSLVSVDRQRGIKERQIDYSKRTVSAYRKRLYGAINNPLKLYGLRDYKQNAAIAKGQIKETRRQIDELRQIREAVTSCLDDRRAGLQTEVRTKTEAAQKLNHTLELKLGFHGVSGEEHTLPEFTDKELDRLEANARILRDPKLLKNLFQHFERHYGMNTKGIQMIAARAGKTLEYAKDCLADVNNGIRAFNEKREFVPVLFKGTNAEDQSATLSDLNRQATGRNIFARILNDSTAPLERSKEALNQRSQDLLQERTTIKSFVEAASDVANYYRETFTAALRADITALHQPTQSYELKDHTPSGPTNVDEHLKQVRQTIDSLQNGAINGTGIEVGIAEAETAASESLAALI
jgi:hypothetical protein